MTRPQSIPEQTQDVVTALRVHVDALAAELERLRAESEADAQIIAADAQIIEGWKRAIGSQYAEIESLRSCLALAERALEAARAFATHHQQLRPGYSDDVLREWEHRFETLRLALEIYAEHQAEGSPQ